MTGPKKIKKSFDKANFSGQSFPMNAIDLFNSVRKPMPRPSEVLGEKKRKNAFKRREKFRKPLE